MICINCFKFKFWIVNVYVLNIITDDYLQKLGAKSGADLCSTMHQICKSSRCFSANVRIWNIIAIRLLFIYSHSFHLFVSFHLFAFFSFIRLLFIYLSYFLFPSSAVKPREKFAPNIFCSSAINDKLASLSIFNVLISLQNTFIALRFIYRLKSMWELSLYKYMSLLWRKYGADFRPWRLPDCIHL